MRGAHLRVGFGTVMCVEYSRMLGGLLLGQLVGRS